MKLLRTETARILVEAHRGGDALAAANSWSGILAAAEAGADLIEVDVQLTADGLPLLYHDYRLPGGDLVARTPGPIAARAAGGEGPPPPRLDELLEWLKGQEVGLTLDVKNGFGQGVAPFATVVEAVRRAGVAEQVMLAAWDHMGLLWAKRHLPALTTRALLRGNPIDLVAVATRAEVDAIALSYDLIDPSDVEALHEVGIAVMLAEMWEPNFRAPVQLGVDLVSWGDPAEAAFALQQQDAR